MKNIINRKGFFVITTVLLALTLVSVFFMGMKAEGLPLGYTSPNIPLGQSGMAEIDIVIEKPKGWITKETPIKITVNTSLRLHKVEAKTTNGGSYTNISDDMTIELSENCTVYVQVTDSNGNVYTKSRYIEVFDRENPTVKAKISSTLLTVEANDNLSGVSAIYIDGERYDGLINDTLDVRVKSLGKEFDVITIQAVDGAGNKSQVITVKNPNFKDNSDNKNLNEQASTTTEKKDGTATTTTETSGTATGTNTTAPTTSTTAPPTAGGAATETDNKNNSGSGESSEAPLFGTFEDTNKQFMSIVTKDGAVYYMIIDHDKPSENVYFLSEVTNAELASFTPASSGEFTDEAQSEDYPEFIPTGHTVGEQPKEEVGFIDDAPKEEETSTDDTDTSQNENEVPSEPASGGSPGTYILMVIAILGVGGAGYYFKIYKPKKELEASDDLDDFEFAEDEDNNNFSDNLEDVQDDSVDFEN